jgi:hypothetical protein
MSRWTAESDEDYYDATHWPRPGVAPVSTTVSREDLLRVKREEMRRAVRCEQLRPKVVNE